jgi:hypothetical protein
METISNKVIYSQFEAGSGIHHVQAVVVYCGKDIVVTVIGGDTPHVGAAAVASPRKSLKRDGTISATASVLCVMGHQDDIPARIAALRLAGTLNATAEVTVGLHIDDAAEEDIIKIQNNFDELIDSIIGKFTDAAGLCPGGLS